MTQQIRIIIESLNDAGDVIGKEIGLFCASVEITHA